MAAIAVGAVLFPAIGIAGSSEVTIVIKPVPPVFAGNEADVTATVTSEGKAIAGTTVAFTATDHGGAVIASRGSHTDENGVALFHFPAVTVAGVYGVHAEVLNASAATDATVTVQPLRATTVGLSAPTTMTIGKDIPLGLTLQGPDGPLPGAVLSVILDGATVHELKTGAGGSADYSLAAPALGKHDVSVRFAGDVKAGLAASAASAVVTVVPLSRTTITLGLPSPTPTGVQTYVTATLEAGGVRLPHATVTAVVDGATSFSTVTSNVGVATFAMPRDLKLGPHTIVVSFAPSVELGADGATAQGTFQVIAPWATWISLALPNDYRVGQALAAVVRVYTGSRPVPNATVHIVAVGRHVALTTDVNGRTVYRLPRNLAPGTYSVSVTYNGARDQGYLGSAASGKFALLPPLVTYVSVHVGSPITTGDGDTVEGGLTSAIGAVSGRVPVHLLIDGHHLVTVITRPNGTFSFNLPRSLAAGSHTITAEYHGDRSLGILGSSARTTLVIKPLVLTFQTGPALAGVTFKVDRTSAVTGADGRATLQLATVGAHTVTVSPPGDTTISRIRFAHWFDNDQRLTKPMRIFADTKVYAMFSASYLTPIVVRDASGGMIDERRLGPMTISAPEGKTLILGPTDKMLWLDVHAPSRAQLLGLAQTPRFALQSATYDGVDVANHGDSPFTPSKGKAWEISLRIYSMQLQLRKPVLGGSINGVVVTGSDGVSQTLQPDAAGRVTLTGLPRGLYTVRTMGNVSPTLIVQVTRNQVVQVSAYTPVEVGGIALLIVAGIAAVIGAAIVVQSRTGSGGPPENSEESGPPAAALA
jgi:hypothetical protein